MKNTDFQKFASSDCHVSPMAVDKYSRLIEGSVNPVILEERRLLMDRIIFLGEPIDDEVSNIIQAQLLYLASTNGRAEISLYLNTPGGSVSAGLGIYDTMQLVTPPVATVCTGMAASMGSVLLCAGEKGRRSALPHSRVMIHQPMGGVRGQASDILIEAREIDRLRKELYSIIAAHSGQSFERVFQDADRDFWMSADEALRYGMIDEVLVKRVPKP